MKKDEKRNFLISAGVVFSVIGVAHLFTLIYGWSLTIDGWPIPKFFNIIAVAVTLYLAHKSFKFA